ncbi:MAG TPA: zinc metallopeptidase [Clostridiales bacterium]|nr:zinc metallopeptidase [Clostridiales bacterium]
MPFFYYESTYILVIIGVILSLFASFRVKSTFAKYSKIMSFSGITGAQAAERILQSSGIYDVSVQRVSGDLTDHYDPRSKVLRLSDSVYSKGTIAAIGVAAHECGHAIQHNKEYLPLKLRSAIVPVANIGSTLAMPLIFIGILLGSSPTLINLGIIFFSFAVLFQIITLPVELDASKRAIQRVGELGVLHGDEVDKARKVLNAAAFTYVAAATASILQLLRLVLLFGGRSRD